MTYPVSSPRNPSLVGARKAFLDPYLPERGANMICKKDSVKEDLKLSFRWLIQQG